MRKTHKIVVSLWQLLGENEVGGGTEGHSTYVLARNTCLAVCLECVPLGTVSLLIVIQASDLLSPPRERQIPATPLPQVQLNPFIQHVIFPQLIII